MISSTVASSSSRVTTLFTNPSDCICVAVQRSPSIIISSNTLRGRLRASTAWIIIGQTPTLISGVAKVAVSTATRRSHEPASPIPPASAWLETAQVGARGESPIPSTCEDHASHGVIVLAPPKGGDKIENHPRRQRISLLGAVQRDRGDVACRRQQHVV